MKIFIVGITGKVEFRLARTLKERGYEVDGLYRQPDQAGCSLVRQHADSRSY